MPPVEPVAERAARAQAPDRRDVPVPVGVRQRPQRRRRPRAAPLQEPVELRPRPDDVLDVRRRRREPHGLADARDRPLDHALERRVPVLAPRRHARAPVPAPLDGVPAAVAHVRRQRPLQRVPQVRGVLAQPLDRHGPPLQEPREPRVGAGLGVAPPRLRRVAAPERDVLRHVDLEPVVARGEEGREVLACGGRARLSRAARDTRRGRGARAGRQVGEARRAVPPELRRERGPPRAAGRLEGVRRRERARQEVERQARVALRFQPLRGGLLDAALQRVVGRRREAVRVAVPVRRSRSSRVRVRVREALVAPDGRGRARARGAGDDARGGREVVPVARELGVPPDAPSAGGAPRTRQSTGGPRSRTQRRASAARGPPPPPPPARRRSTKATCAASGRRARSPRRRGGRRARAAVADAAVVRRGHELGDRAVDQRRAGRVAGRGEAVEGRARRRAAGGAGRRGPRARSARPRRAPRRSPRATRPRASPPCSRRARTSRRRARAGASRAPRSVAARAAASPIARASSAGAVGRAWTCSATCAARRGGGARPSAAGFPRRPRRPPRGRTGPRRRRRGRAAARPAPPAPATRAPPRPPPRRPRRRRTRAPRPRPRAGPAARAQLRARDEVAQRELEGARCDP